MTAEGNAPQIDLAELRSSWESARSGFIEHLDLHIDSLDRGSAVVRLPFRPEIANRGGVVHGGAIAALCDSAFFVAHATIFGRDAGNVTVDLTCNFLAPARPPHDLLAHAKVLKAGRRIVFGEVGVYSGERLVAHATLNFMNVKR